MGCVDNEIELGFSELGFGGTGLSLLPSMATLFPSSFPLENKGDIKNSLYYFVCDFGTGHKLLTEIIKKNKNKNKIK